jgi:polynucleotide 5'-hydroxyl-kinase GRC3/NOL9
VPASQLFYALNGTVVGLCGPASAPQKPAAAAPAPAGAGVAPAPPAAALPCLGLGIVRAADAARRRLHILTTVPPEELEGVTTLQLGKLELPGSLLQTGAHMAPYLCLFSLSSMGTGAGAIKSRNNLLRQSQL